MGGAGSGARHSKPPLLTALEKSEKPSSEVLEGALFFSVVCGWGLGGLEPLRLSDPLGVDASPIDQSTPVAPVAPAEPAEPGEVLRSVACWDVGCCRGRMRGRLAAGLVCVTERGAALFAVGCVPKSLALASRERSREWGPLSIGAVRSMNWTALAGWPVRR